VDDKPTPDEIVERLLYAAELFDWPVMKDAADLIAHLRAADGQAKREQAIGGAARAIADHREAWDHVPSDQDIALATIVVDALAATGGEGERLLKRPVAFRVKDHADGWILFTDEQAAVDEADKTDGAYQGLYVRDGKE
jgi:hypothetical protein